MKKGLILTGLLFWGIFSATAVASRTWTVERIFLKPVRDSNPHSPQHGDIYVVYTDKRQARLTTSGLCFDPKRAADRKTIGWVAGEHYNYRDMGKVLFPAKIVCQREGRKLAIIRPEKIFTVYWEFQQNGRHVAVSSQGSHGPVYLQLFDSRTGRIIDQCMEYDEKKPAWAKKLPAL